MLATYGVDLLDPAVSLRRVHVLVSLLPPGAASAVEDDTAWSVEAHLLAHLGDAVNSLTYVTLKANGAKGAKQPPTIPRPGRRRNVPQGGRKVPWGELVGVLRGQGVNGSG